ncbi:MAG TPA: IS91 family transposase [Prolixibacteraceae bacterium]|nr:IS91 family transposase [Prolixibacteraceae bacterium]HQL70225.1 IS91 family transposase [Bacteroidales bacterium]
MENIRQQFDIADIFSNYKNIVENNEKLCHEQIKAFNDIVACRTDALGGHKAVCDHCGNLSISYNSCRNRHCPKCQFTKKALWVDKIAAKLPPVKHFHLVFTVPHSLNKLFYLNQAAAYNCLFKAAGKALIKLTANPDFLGAQTGAVAILHTWGQNLSYHPHVHMIVPAGGLSEDATEWVPANPKFLVPVKVLGRIFRGEMYRSMLNALQSETMKLPDDIADYNDFKARCYLKNWVVYCERPFCNAESLIAYLGNYTHRVAISNHRIQNFSNGKVRLSCKDYRNAGKKRSIELDAKEFIRRFLQHILPKGFYKIRYFGFMAMRNAKTKLAQCFELIDKTGWLPILQGLPALDIFRLITGNDPIVCPICKTGKLKYLINQCNPIAAPG